MLDLNAEPFIFKSHTIPEIQDELIQSIPNAAVTYKEGKKPKIQIRSNMWTGASLEIHEESGTIRLSKIEFQVFSIFRVIIILLLVSVLFSLGISIAYYIGEGKWLWMFAVVGVLPAVIIGIPVENFVLWLLNRSWRIELVQILEKLKV